MAIGTDEWLGQVVEEIVPAVVPLSLLHRTLRALLSERVSIRDLGSILDTLAEHAGRIQDPDLLTDLVRERLGRSITRPYLQDDGRLPVITLSSDLEEQLRSVVQRSESGSFLAVDPVTLDGLAGELANESLSRLPALTSFPGDFDTFWPDSTSSSSRGSPGGPKPAASRRSTMRSIDAS